MYFDLLSLFSQRLVMGVKETRRPLGVSMEWTGEEALWLD